MIAPFINTLLRVYIHIVGWWPDSENLIADSMDLEEVLMSSYKSWLSLTQLTKSTCEMRITQTHCQIIFYPVLNFKCTHFKEIFYYISFRSQDDIYKSKYCVPSGKCTVYF